MSSVCAEQHKFHPSHQLLSSKKTLFRDNNLDIPPRKLLTRRTAQELIPSSDIYSSPPDPYSPRFSAADETLLSKFLPYNTGASDDEDDAASDPYSSDHFRMFEFKVRRCTRSRSHDWTDCPFAHPGEKARRRDPRRHHYSGTVCADYRRGSCSLDDGCEFAHGVFECWLHPARYRTEACKDGKNCKRKVCFFAHTPRQLRVLPVNQSSDHQVLSPTPNMSSKKKFHLNSAAGSNKRCCLFCHSVTTSSPTSTLLGMSHISPPMSPAANAPIMSRSGGGLGMGLGLDQMHAGAGGMFMSYKDALAELMTSLEAMKFNEAAASSSPVSPNNMNCSNFAAANPNSHRWVDVSFNVDHQDHQQQFILSPSTPSPSPSAGRGNFFNRDEYCSPRKSSAIDNDPINVDSGSGTGSDPDLGWVNDLLM